MRNIFYLLFILFVGLPLGMFAQQNPQYTMYMYNTQQFNPAYAGNRDVLSADLLYRTQWLGMVGAPETSSFSLSSPVGRLKKMGLGVSFFHDEIGVSKETDLTVDYSYSIFLNYNTKLSFGLKAGVSVLDMDFTKLDIFNPEDPLFQGHIDNRWQPKFGAGVYLNSDRWYVGLSAPNFFETKHYDKSKDPSYKSAASEKMHFYLMGGYVFDLSSDVKFKPATLLKAVAGAPLQWDVSANFLFHEKLTLGTAWRWDAAVSALAGFQVNPNVFIGVGYDYQLNELKKYNDGSYEVILRFDIVNSVQKILTPRFF